MNNLDFILKCKLVQHLLHLNHLHISAIQVDGVEGVFERTFRDRLHNVLQSQGVHLPIVIWSGSNKTEAEVGSKVGWTREIKVCIWIEYACTKYNSLGFCTGFDCLFEVWLWKLKISDVYFFGGDRCSLIEELIKYVKISCLFWANGCELLHFNFLNLI